MEDNIKPLGGPEPTVQFKLESDRDLYEINNPQNDETLIKITGYDVQFWFNHKYLQSIEEIEAACNGIHSLFRDLIIQQILGKSKLNGEN